VRRNRVRPASRDRPGGRGGELPAGATGRDRLHRAVGHARLEAGVVVGAGGDLGAGRTGGERDVDFRVGVLEAGQGGRGHRGGGGRGGGGRGVEGERRGGQPGAAPPVGAPEVGGRAAGAAARASLAEDDGLRGAVGERRRVLAVHGAGEVDGVTAQPGGPAGG